MKNSQKGFVVPLLLGIIAILVIGGGVYVYKNKKTEIPAEGKPFSVSSLKVGVPKKMDSGSPVAFLVGTNELIVRDFDKKLSKDGCEGLPQPVLIKISNKDLSRHPLLDAAGKPYNGRIMKGPQNKVAIIDGCEGYLVSVFVGEDIGGDFKNLKRISLPKDKLLHIISWGASADQLIAKSWGYEDAPFPVFSLDVLTGSINKIFEPSGIFRGGTLYIGNDMFFVERMEKDESDRLIIRKYNGEVVNEITIPKFDAFVIGPKNNILAIKDNNLYILGAKNNFSPTLISTLPINETVHSWHVFWEPSGRYFAFITSDSDPQKASGSLILMDLQGNQIIIDSVSGSSASPVFSDDGTRLAWLKAFKDPVKNTYQAHAYVVDLSE